MDGGGATSTGGEVGLVVSSISSHDTLQELLDRQRQLQTRMPRFGPPGPEGSERQARQVRDYAVMLAREAHEVLDCTAWKKHKTDYGRRMTPEELEHAREEVVDCLHFVLNLLLVVGLEDAREVRHHFLAKHEENHDRVSRGY